QFQRTVISRLEAVPGVESASMVGTGAVLLGREAQVSLPEWADSQALACGYIEIGPRYFETLRTPVLRGREFDERDTLRSLPVAIVNETLAHRFWLDGRVIGATLMVKRRPHQVVGIVQGCFFPESRRVFHALCLRALLAEPRTERRASL